MARCSLCNVTAADISAALGVCLRCLRQRPDEALSCAMEAHRKSRAAFGLPEAAPKAPDGVPCEVCVHECRIPEGEVGLCGLRRNEGGKVIDVSSEKGKLSWYHDPLPTNCVGDWVCAGCTGAGYPRYAYCQGPERGYKNLAVFFQAWDETLHLALTGVSNKRTLENFARAGEKTRVRPVPPVLIASTLLVPGYIDQDEIRRIARFIGSIDPTVPYSLLAFHPHFVMTDLPLTPRSLAEDCVRIAQEEGLINIKVGNAHLLV